MPSLAEMLMGYLPKGASPVFGTITPQEQAMVPPTGLDQAVGGAINSMATLPQRAVQNSQFALNTGVYDPAVPLEAAMTTMGATPFGSGMAGTSPVFGAGPIKAYHGSPHDFDAFDLSKIGTGEGAQAYGHGLYFAENPAVSESYKAAGQPSYLGADRIKAAQDLLAEAGGDRQAAIALADTRMRGTTKYSEGKLWTDVVNNFDDLVGKSPGKMYEVNINADPEHFLDWDKPLSEQPEIVRKAMVSGDAPALQQKLDQVVAQKEAFASDRDPVTNRMRNEQGWHQLANEADKLQTQLRGVVSEDLSGQAAYRRMHENAIRSGKAELAKIKEQQVAQALKDAGIPGIKYLDQGSRASGQGSSNYVVFNDKLIDILRKYGLAGAAATGAMSSPAYGPQQPNLTAQALMEGS